MPIRNCTIAILLSAACLAGAARADSLIPKSVPTTPPDPEIERKSFKVADGFEVTLWAADPQIAKPVQMNWDAQGRLWIASSSMYPQIKPGETPVDKVLVLEDTDGDGKSDKSTVFADGLLLPTAVIPDNVGGAYVANSTELLHFKDTNNDLKADERKVVLTGFGTEDTHHILHTFRWGPDGRLYMNQSIYIHSHVETPHGTRRLMGSGIWRFKPDSVDFDVVFRGMVNPWGQAWDRFGQSFSTDGAGDGGIYYSFNGSAFQTAVGYDRVLNGMNPGSPKYCGLEIVSGRHLPDDWQGDAITNDFRANRVVRYKLIDENGTFISKQMPDVITSTDVAFRPIDVKMGPDGAIYLADWYNPIINHGEVDFRDPRRDHTHGRIWRISAKGRPLVERPTLVGVPTADVLEQLKSPEGWTRDQAKQVLRGLGASAVVPALSDWVAKLSPNDPEAEHHRLEALWTYQSVDAPAPELLTALLHSQVPQVRAAATHVLPDWADRMPNAIDLLATQVNDELGRVRLEAVRALARIGSPKAIELAATVLDRPLDTSIEYALWATLNETQNAWLPAFTSGQMTFKSPKHVTYALLAVKSPAALGGLVAQLKEGKIPAESRATVFERIAQSGGPDEAKVVYDIATDASTDPAIASSAIGAVADAIRKRKVAPAGADAAKLEKLVAGSNASEDLRAAAVRLAGAWKAAALRDEIAHLAQAQDTPAGLRRAAVDALAEWGGDSADVLRKLDSSEQAFNVREMAIIGLSSVDLNDSARRAAELLAAAKSDQNPSTLLAAFVLREGGVDALAKALQGKRLSPDVAKLGLRYVTGTAREMPALTQRLRESAGVGAGVKLLTPEQMAAMIQEVQAKGDAKRGEVIFRRADMSCYQCHGIGGAGGQLGPDLRAIGASSPMDYLIDSIIEPNKSIKDGYQSVIIQTKKGEVFSGIKVSTDDKQVILKDATHDRIVIDAASIKRDKPGDSLMPGGLADALTHGEFLDLVKFMSELGKPGPYGPDTALLVRRWRVLDGKPAMRVANNPTLLANPDAVAVQPWQPAYGLVSGVLPLEATATSKTPQDLTFARGEIEVTAPGKIGLHVGDPKGLTLWVDGKPVELTSEQVSVELEKGVHALTFKIDVPSRQGTGIRVEIREVPGSKGHAQPIGGR
jgi:putative heme-binding domain-containing protein